MSQNCTIYSNKEFKEAVEFLQNSQSLDVSDSGILSFEKTYLEGNLKISIKRRKRPGDEFSKMILGTWAFFEDIETRYRQLQEDLLKSISSGTFAIGIVATPEFTETDERLDFIFEIAENFDGLIFNGFEMLDKKGRTVLDKDGNSEIAN
jgi:hypothetical protein